MVELRFHFTRHAAGIVITTWLRLGEAITIKTVNCYHGILYHITNRLHVDVCQN